MIIRVIAVTVACFFVIGCSRIQPLASPSFTVASSNQSTVHQAIREALLARRWAIVAETPTSFDATYRRGAGITATIRVNHQGDIVSISYKDSRDLEFSDKPGTGPVIHKTYNHWVANLENDILFEVGRLR